MLRQGGSVLGLRSGGEVQCGEAGGDAGGDAGGVWRKAATAERGGVPKGSAGGEDEADARSPKIALIPSTGVRVSPSSRKRTRHWLSKAQ